MAQIGELSTTSGGRKFWWIVGALVIAGLSVGLAAKAGSFLVVDAPHRSDAILVLAGETDRRPLRALELLSQGLASGLYWMFRIKQSCTSSRRLS